MNYGFVRVAAGIPRIKVADCEHNVVEISKLIKQADNNSAQIMVLPELCVTGYTCGDLFHQHTLVRGAEEWFGGMIEAVKKSKAVVIAGIPVFFENRILNCAAVVQAGKILGIIPKTIIPGAGEHCEGRWFGSGGLVKDKTVLYCRQEVPIGTDLLFEAEGEPEVCFGVEICEDLWAAVPPSSHYALGGATLIFNLSASSESIGKHEYCRSLVEHQSAKCIAGYVYTSAGVGESTTDLVFGGQAIIAENGILLKESTRFERESQLIYSDVDVERLVTDRRKTASFEAESGRSRGFRKVRFKLRAEKMPALAREVAPYPFIPSDESLRSERCREVFSIQANALAKRLEHTGVRKVVVGVSGGLDSALALLVCGKTMELMNLPSNNVIGVTMPGFGTSDGTLENALALLSALGTDARNIPINEACEHHFRDIGHDPAVRDIVFENVQARERTQILMDIANKENALVVGTGDMSELALGWMTYNGDHMSMYAVNIGVPKTLIRFVVKWIAENASDKNTSDVLKNILNMPISPELTPAGENGEMMQKTEEIIGPYELHDFFLYYIIRYGFEPDKILYLANIAFKGIYEKDAIKKWLKVFLKRFFEQQYKRSCLPDGPKVGSISLSPRSDWRMPSDASAKLWLDKVE